MTLVREHLIDLEIKHKNNKESKNNKIFAFCVETINNENTKNRFKRKLRG